MEEQTNVAMIEAENMKLKEKLRFYQEYDLLTGLYNKQTFEKRTGEFLRSCKELKYDIVCIDIQKFGLINEQYGFEVGDSLLKYLAKTLKEALCPIKGLISRSYNDLFALLLPSSERDRIEEVVIQIFQNYKLSMSVFPAIGIYPISYISQSVSSMCAYAIKAMESIKGSYVKYSAVYDTEQLERLLEEQSLLDDVESALENKDFKVYIQPKCNMLTGKIMGGEALVRWQHGMRGMVSPGIFIPLFERNGFIRRLDIYIWETTAAWIRKRVKKGLKPLPVSINVSRQDIYSMDVCTVLENIVERYGIDKKYLEVEITETAYSNRQETIIQTTDKLMKSGFKVLMDDFGSGYSSLNMLTDINVNVLKIDMRFLAKQDKKSRSILQTVVQMGKWLNIDIIVEGVETQEQVSFLTDIGCNYAQGFFYYRPMPIDELDKLLQDETKVDFEDEGRFQFSQDMTLNFRDLLQRDIITDSLLNNIMGAVAIYSFDGKSLSVLQGTEEYYRHGGFLGKINGAGWDILKNVYADDTPILLKALEQAKEDSGIRGAEVVVRKRYVNEIRWVRLSLYHLMDKTDSDLYYGVLTDLNEQMNYLSYIQDGAENSKQSLYSSDIMFFDLDLNTQEAHFSDYTVERFALQNGNVVPVSRIFESDIIADEFKPDVKKLNAYVTKSKKQVKCILLMRMSDGVNYWNRVTVTPIKDKKGNVVKHIGMVEVLSSEDNISQSALKEIAKQRMIEN